MESWEVVVIGGNPAALRAAISASDGGASTLLIDSAGIGSRQGNPPYAGLAASLGEIDSSAHRDDTILAGGEKTNKISAANFCGLDFTQNLQINFVALKKEAPLVGAAAVWLNAKGV